MSRVLFVVCLAGSLLLAAPRFMPCAVAVEVTPLAPPATSAAESYVQHSAPGWGTQPPASLAAPANSDLYAPPLVSHGRLVSKEVWDKYSKRPGAFGGGRGTDPATMYDASKARVVSPRPQQPQYPASPSASYAAPKRAPSPGRVVLPTPAGKSQAAVPVTGPTRGSASVAPPTAEKQTASAAPAKTQKPSPEKATQASSQKATPPPHAPVTPAALAAPLAQSSSAVPPPGPAASEKTEGTAPATSPSAVSTPPPVSQQQAPANISASWIIHPRPAPGDGAKASSPVHSPAPSYLAPETAAKITDESATLAGPDSAASGPAASGQPAADPSGSPSAAGKTQP